MQNTGSQRRNQIIAGVKLVAPIALSLLGARFPAASTIGRVGLGVLEASTSKDEGVPDTSSQTKGQ
jgi:hypothetical protein